MSKYPVLKRNAAKFDGNGIRVRYGGCSCGAVRFEVRGAPTKVGICHCMECRKATGAVYVSYADWPRRAFVSSGEAGQFRGRSFCPICGSRLFHISESEVEVMMGALDEGPGDLTPTREGWIKRREHWLTPVADADQFDEDPAPATQP